jgi:rSAM/selenodomain-associated transferase 1
MTSSAPADSPVRVAVFAKAPVPGEVKTRLAPALGAEGASRLHEALVRRALETALAAGVGPVELWCAPDASHPFFVECAAKMGVRLRQQAGGDLGHRMAAAFRAALCDNARLVLIGSDCPALTPESLREAARALGEHEAVLAPAEDGGYVLVGLSGPDHGIFDRIPWGGGEVMAQTRSRLRTAGMSWTELGTFWDIDRPEDYARLEREGLLRAGAG